KDARFSESDGRSDVCSGGIPDERRDQGGGKCWASGARLEISLHRVQEVSRPGRISCGSAAMGDIQRNQPEYGGVCLEDSAGRVSRVSGQGAEQDGDGE